MTATTDTALPGRDWLEARVAALIDDDETPGPDDNLIAFGLDSIGVMKLAGELKEKGIEVSFEELAGAPTVEDWWTLIEKRRAS